MGADYKRTDVRADFNRPTRVVSRPSAPRGVGADEHGASRAQGAQRPAGGAQGREAARRLGTSRTEFPPLPSPALPVHATFRRQRFERRKTSSQWLIDDARRIEGAKDGEWVRPVRPARCGWAVGGAVGVHGSSQQPAHYSGTERCASIWACPVCAAIIRAERAREISTAVTQWQKQGGAVLFVTLTMRHKRSDNLSTTLDAALQGWRYLLQGSPWKKQRARLGIEGYVRAVEVTWGDANGWHPHVHALLFLDKAPTSGDLIQFEHWLYERWARGVVKHGGGLPSRVRGVDLRLADRDGKVLAQYLAKVQEEKKDRPSYDVGTELARADWKTSRGGGNELRYMPFQFLDAPSGIPASALWSEYVAATRGRRAITWSRGLRDLVDLDPEKTDEDVIEEAEQSDLVFTIEADRWREVKRDALLMAAILEAVELDQAEAAEHLATGRYLMLDEWWIDVTTGETIRPHRARADMSLRAAL